MGKDCNLGVIETFKAAHTYVPIQFFKWIIIVILVDGRIVKFEEPWFFYWGLHIVKWRIFALKRFFDLWSAIITESKHAHKVFGNIFSKQCENLIENVFLWGCQTCIWAFSHKAYSMNCLYPGLKKRFYLCNNLKICINASCVAKTRGINNDQRWIRSPSLYIILDDICCLRDRLRFSEIL